MFTFKCFVCGEIISPDRYEFATIEITSKNYCDWLECKERRALVSSAGGIQVLSGLSLMDFVELKWVASHNKCSGDDDHYYIPLSEFTCVDDLLTWTAHLMGKSWFADSDWDKYLRAAVGKSAA